MSDIAVLMPSLDRPDNLKRVLADLNTAQGVTPYTVYAIVDETDIESQRVCDEHRARYFTDQRGWYAPRTQQLFELTSEPWVFTGTDDIRFSARWADLLLEAATTSGAKVVAPSDGHNPHPTNFLVDRQYVLDHGGHYGCPGHIFHPDYKHLFVDNEMVAVAIARGTFYYAADVIVEATHPLWGNAENDRTYQRSQLQWTRDEKLYNRRKHLWAS